MSETTDQERTRDLVQRYLPEVSSQLYRREDGQPVPEPGEEDIPFKPTLRNLPEFALDRLIFGNRFFQAVKELQKRGDLRAKAYFKRRDQAMSYVFLSAFVMLLAFILNDPEYFDFFLVFEEPLDIYILAPWIGFFVPLFSGFSAAYFAKRGKPRGMALSITPTMAFLGSFGWGWAWITIWVCAFLIHYHLAHSGRSKRATLYSFGAVAAARIVSVDLYEGPYGSRGKTIKLEFISLTGTQIDFWHSLLASSSASAGDAVLVFYDPGNPRSHIPFHPDHFQNTCLSQSRFESFKDLEAAVPFAEMPDLTTYNDASRLAFFVGRASPPRGA